MYKRTQNEEPKQISILIKGSLRKYVDSGIAPELNLACKHSSFPQGAHRKLLFGDGLPKAMTELTETNKIG